MTSDEFVKNFYIEKLKFLESSFEQSPQYLNAVNTRIKGMGLTEIQTDQLKEVMDRLLDDVFYSILLGLDGECPIGNTPSRLIKYTMKKVILFLIVGNWKPVLMSTFTGANMKKKL